MLVNRKDQGSRGNEKKQPVESRIFLLLLFHVKNLHENSLKGLMNQHEKFTFAAPKRCLPF
jgi:hypothetical protein